MSIKLLVFAMCCTLAVTTGYRFKELSKVIDLPLESSTSKLYLSPTKVGWYDVNTDNREIVMNYKEVDGTFYYESKSYIVRDCKGIITIKDLHDMTEGTYRIDNSKLSLISTKNL